MVNLESGGSFNTGRKYTADGQLIAWRVTSITEPDEFGFADAEIRFVDHSRMVIGTVTVMVAPHDQAPAIERRILAAYDNHQYRPAS